MPKSREHPVVEKMRSLIEEIKNDNRETVDVETGRVKEPGIIDVKGEMKREIQRGRLTWPPKSRTYEIKQKKEPAEAEKPETAKRGRKKKQAKPVELNPDKIKLKAFPYAKTETRGSEFPIADSRIEKRDIENWGYLIESSVRTPHLPAPLTELGYSRLVYPYSLSWIKNIAPSHYVLEPPSWTHHKKTHLLAPGRRKFVPKEMPQILVPEGLKTAQPRYYAELHGKFEPPDENFMKAFAKTMKLGNARAGKMDKNGRWWNVVSGISNIGSIDVLPEYNRIKLHFEDPEHLLYFANHYLREHEEKTKGLKEISMGIGATLGKGGKRITKNLVVTPPHVGEFEELSQLRQILADANTDAMMLSKHLSTVIHHTRFNDRATLLAVKDFLDGKAAKYMEEEQIHPDVEKNPELMEKIYLKLLKDREVREQLLKAVTTPKLVAKRKELETKIDAIPVKKKKPKEKTENEEETDDGKTIYWHET